MIFLLALLGCTINTDNSILPEKQEVEVKSESLAGYKPLPSNYLLSTMSPENEIISLGEKLYNEKLLSVSGEISCSSCHDLSSAGIDGTQFSAGHNESLTSRNTPTVFNAAGHVSQFWDGRATTVEEQALGPILAAGEMAMPNPESVVTVLKSKTEYVEGFRLSFPDQQDPITFQNVGIAIGSYERTLVTPSRWDLFLNGDGTALSDEEKTGFITFSNTGCGTCHGGQLLGGQLFMKVGLVNTWPNQNDLGRYNVTKNESDKMVFKVPSLRNVAVTGPYFHDGSVDNLQTAIKMMGHYQLGKDLTDSEAKSIENWLESTTGVLINQKDMDK